MLLQHSISTFEAESTELQNEHRYAEQLSQRAMADTTSRRSLRHAPVLLKQILNALHRLLSVSNVAKQVYSGSSKFIELLLSNSLMN